MNFTNLVKIPFLNVTRNFRRTLITCLGIAFGTGALVLFDGYFSYMFEGLREVTIRSGLGHVQIYKKGFNEFKFTEPEKYLLSREDVENIRGILDQDERVLLTSARTNFTGLLSNGNNSLPVLITGAEAENEQLINSSVLLTEGDFFSEDVPESVNIGKILANNLKIKPGDVMTLSAATVDGYLNALDVTVTGIVETGISALDERMLYGNVSYMNLLYDTDSFSGLIILLENTEDTPAFETDLEALITKDSLDYETKDWEELAVFYRQVVTFLTSIFDVLRLIIISVIVFFIANTMIMNVMERIPEIGTMRAMGKTRPGVVILFLSESVYIGITGGIIGIVIGYFVAIALNNAGLMLPPPPSMNVSTPLMFKLELESFVEAFILCCATAFFSGIYPAFKAGQMKIADALRFH